jgi:hypothetical protein
MIVHRSSAGQWVRDPTVALVVRERDKRACDDEIDRENTRGVGVPETVVDVGVGVE